MKAERKVTEVPKHLHVVTDKDSIPVQSAIWDAICMQASIREIVRTIHLAGGEMPHVLKAKVDAIDACIERAERALLPLTEEDTNHG